MKKLIFSVLLFVLLSSIPKVLNYQGKLLDSEGVGVNETVNIIFRVYTSETGGTPIWVEEHSGANAVDISKGLFSTELGSIIPFPDTVDFSQQYWLELVVNSETITPREKLTSVPYALHADKVTNAFQSFSSELNPERRRGSNFVFRPGDGATLADSSGNIYITLGTCGTSSSGTIPSIYDVLIAGNNAGGYGIHNLANPEAPQDAVTKAYVDDYSVSSISGGNGLSPDDPSQGIVTLNVNIDDATIGISGDALYVKNSGITSTQIATDAVTSDEILTGAVTTDEIANGTIITEDINSIDWSKIDKTISSVDDIADVNLTTPTVGDIAYFDGNHWVNLNLGSAGQMLAVNPSGTLPYWETPDARAVYNFYLDAEPSADGVQSGLNVSTDITAYSITGTPMEIEFYVSGLSSGVSANFIPSAFCTPSGGPPSICTRTLELSTTTGATRGTYPITVTGATLGGSVNSTTYLLTIATTPGAVSDLTAELESGEVVLNWTAPSDNGGSLVTGYIIYRGTSPNPTDSLSSVGSVLTFTDTDIEPENTYYYRVSAVNAIGPGTYSNEVSLELSYATGGEISIITDGDIDYRVHTYTSVGNYTFIANFPIDVEVLVVAGGGGGGGGFNSHAYGGGGGAGGLLYNTSFSVTSQDYPVTVGAGGAGGTGNQVGFDGANSVFATLTAIGGGGGGKWIGSGGTTAGDGGSGGGGGTSSGSCAGGSGTSGQGNNGGTGTEYSGNSTSGGGGGGGANSIGGNGSGSTGGNGGSGSTYSISGSAVTYAGGGGGGAGSTGGTGGSGGGGAGGSSTGNGFSATANTGGGGGGAANNMGGDKTGGNGGSGIVIVRYPI